MKRSRVRKIGMVLLLFMLVLGISWWLRPPTPFIPIKPSVQFLPYDMRMPSQPMTIFERCVPVSWSWLWRLRDYWRGPLAGIVIDAKIFECAPLTETELEEWLRPPLPAFAETNGLRGWILDDAALARIGQRLETPGGRVISHPRVQTSHGIQSSLAVGSPAAGAPGSQVGLSLDLLPLIQRDGAELISILTLSEMTTNQLAGSSLANGGGGGFIRTNLATATQWKIRDGMGFLMLGPATSNETRRLGVIVSATMIRPRQ